jgi:hypothetical protein
MSRQRKPDKVTLRTFPQKKPEELSSVGFFPEKPPERLADDAKQAWLDVVAACPFRVLGPADIFVVELCASLVAEHRRDPDGMNSARLTQYRCALASLGLTPADRAKLSDFGHDKRPMRPSSLLD